MNSPPLSSPPQARPVRTRSGFVPRQSRLRSILEILAVFLAFCGVWVLGGLRPEWFATLPVQVALQGTLTLLLIAVLTALGPSTAENLGLRRSGVLREVGVGALSLIPIYGAALCVSWMAMLLRVLVVGESLESIYQSKEPIFSAVATVPLAAVLPLALFVGIYEELLFRGFLLGRTAAMIRSRTAVVILNAIAFGLLHYGSQGWFGVLQTSCIGALLAGLTLWRGSIWAAITCHALIDVVGITGVLLYQYLMSQAEAGGSLPGA